MLDALDSVVQFLFYSIQQTWQLYTMTSVLGAFFALWVLDRLFHIFDILKR